MRILRESLTILAAGGGHLKRIVKDFQLKSVRVRMGAEGSRQDPKDPKKSTRQGS